MGKRLSKDVMTMKNTKEVKVSYGNCEPEKEETEESKPKVIENDIQKPESKPSPQTKSQPEAQTESQPFPQIESQPIPQTNIQPKIQSNESLKKQIEEEPVIPSQNLIENLGKIPINESVNLETQKINQIETQNQHLGAEQNVNTNPQDFPGAGHMDYGMYPMMFPYSNYGKSRFEIIKFGKVWSKRIVNIY